MSSVAENIFYFTSKSDKNNGFGQGNSHHKNIRQSTGVKDNDMNDKIKQIQGVNSVNTVNFEQIFTAHFDGMFRYCMTMVNDQAEAEDIVQAVFTELWQDRHKTKFHTSIQAFLYKAVYFKCMNRIKHEKVNQKYISSLPQESYHTTDSNPALLMEVNMMINAAVDSLPEQCRKIFSMSRYEGMRYQEIADHLQLSVKTIENQMGKALKSLRIHLADYLQVIIFNLITFF